MKKTGPKLETDEPRDIIIAIKFSKEEIEEIDKIAKNIDIPRATLIRNMTFAGFEDAKILNKIGALKGARKWMDFKERFFNPEKYKTLEEA